MNKYILITVLAIALMLPGMISASEVTGTFNGTVAAPEVTNPEPTPQPQGNRGGSGGSGGGATNNNSSLRGDANKDGRVDILDFAMLMAQWGRVGAGNSADFNTDSRVDILDFVVLMASWTK